MTNRFYNNLLFRISAPLFFGVVFYLLVLMFFDSVQMLSQNFFSREVLFTIGLTFIFFEFNRLVVVFLNYFFRNKNSLSFRIPVQFLVAIIVSVAVVSSILYLYFNFIEGFSTIQTELITFNSIYILAALFYHLYFFSLFFLYKKNDKLIHKELNKKQNLEIEMSNFKNQINPDFLFESLEVIISELYRDKKKSDELIEDLGRFYRYALDNIQNELISLPEELNSLQPIIHILKSKYGDKVAFNIKSGSDQDYHLIPGTLHILIENVIKNNIIDDNLPLVITFSIEDKNLRISFNKRDRLIPKDNTGNRLRKLNELYSYYSGKEIVELNKGEIKEFLVPLLEVDEE